jgi:hypothetical protein
MKIKYRRRGTYGEVHFDRAVTNADWAKVADLPGIETCKQFNYSLEFWKGECFSWKEVCESIHQVFSS